MDVQCESQVVAGYRRRARQRAHGAAAGIDLDFLDAGAAVELAFVRQFAADLAEVV
jgi:hypothetical protein